MFRYGLARYRAVRDPKTISWARPPSPRGRANSRSNDRPFAMRTLRKFQRPVGDEGEVPTDVVSSRAVCTRRRFFFRFCLLTRTRRSWDFSPSALIAWQNNENLARPTRFERVTFAFGGQTPTPPISEQRIYSVARMGCCKPPATTPQRASLLCATLPCETALCLFVTSTADGN
jgi:hypothetical protein